MSYIIKDMAKFKTNLLNKLADKKENAPMRVRAAKTVYLNTKKFEVFKKLIKPLSPSEAFDEFMDQTIESENKKKS